MSTREISADISVVAALFFARARQRGLCIERNQGRTCWSPITSPIKHTLPCTIGLKHTLQIPWAKHTMGGLKYRFSRTVSLLNESSSLTHSIYPEELGAPTHTLPPTQQAPELP